MDACCWNIINLAGSIYFHQTAHYIVKRKLKRLFVHENYLVSSCNDTGIDVDYDLKY